MPARKNRPNKHGTSPAVHLRENDFDKRERENEMVKKFVAWEKELPGKDHYVGWPDMTAAELMESKGFLRKSWRATGCFYVTDMFKRLFMA